MSGRGARATARAGKPRAWLLGSLALLLAGGTVAWLVARSTGHVPLSPLAFDWPMWMEQRLVICQGWFILGSATALALVVARALQLLLAGHAVAGAVTLRNFPGLCSTAALIDALPIPVAVVDRSLTQSSEVALIVLLDAIIRIVAFCAALHGLAGLCGVRAHQALRFDPDLVPTRLGPTLRR